MIHSIHGNVGNPKDWAPLCGALLCPEQEFNAIHLWQYLRENPLASYDSFANDLNQPVDGTSEPSYLIGYSLGGRLALHALVKNPERWDKAVIVSAHTGLENEPEKSIRIASDELWAQRAETLPWQDFLQQWNSQGILQSDNQNALTTRNELEQYRQEIAHSYRTWSLGRQENLLPQLEKVTTPILWVVGEQDPKFTKLAKQAVSLLPNAELKIIPNSGHRTPWQTPEKFHTVVEEFLA